jgi:uncharacterized protein (TIRG00374 family)
MADAQALAGEPPRGSIPPRGAAGSGRGWRRPLAIALGLAISIAFGWLAMSKISLDQVGTSLADAHYLWVVPATLLLLPIALLRAWRWKLLFNDPDTVPMSDSFAATNVGLMANNILPQRVGEVPRVFALRRTTGISAFEIAATVIVERVLDVFILAVCGAALWPFFPDETWVQALGFLCVGLIVASIVLVAALALFRDRLDDLLLAILRRVPFVSEDRARSMHLALVAGGAILLRPRQLAEVLAISALIWVIGAISIWVLFPAFDLHLGAAAPWLILLANTFAIMLPSGPATLGVYEASVQVALIALGISASTALSYAVVLHAVNFFPVLLLGAACSWWIARQPQATPRPQVQPA